MAQVKNISRESVEKKFKDVFGRSPGAFPEGTSLKEKVNYITKGTEALKAVKSNELENKMKNVANLSKELEKRQKQEDEEIHKLRRSVRELREEFGGNKKSRIVDMQETGQSMKLAEAPTQTGKHPLRIGEFRDNKEFQEAANALRETATKGRSVEQNKQKNTSKTPAQTDAQDNISLQHGVSLSVDKHSTEEKFSNEKLKHERANVPQQQEDLGGKEGGLFNLLKHLVKKILGKLLGEDEKSMGSACDTKEAQRNVSNSEVQQKSMNHSSYIEIKSITSINIPKIDKVNMGRER